MKLPTLNIDLAVNAKTMKKGIAEAQKELQTVGRQGLALGGGGFGKLGAAAGMAGAMGLGGAGSAAIGVGGIVMSVLAPFKGAEMIVTSFADATKRGEEAMKAFAEGKALTGGLDLGTASRLAAGAEGERSKQMAASGIWDTFIGSMMNEQGQVGGLAGIVQDWAQATAEGTKWLAAFTGGVLGGLQDGYAAERADMAISRSVAGAQAYMSIDQINAVADQAEKYRKAQREQNT